MRLLVTLTVFFTAFCASAQDWETIRRSPNYLTGEGYGVTVEEADRNAIADLISKISVRVSTSSSQVQSETLESGQLSATPLFLRHLTLIPTQHLQTPTASFCRTNRMPT